MAREPLLLEGQVRVPQLAVLPAITTERLAPQVLRIELSVFHDNAGAIRLYERHGFELLGTIRAGSSPPIFPMLRRAR